MPLVKAQCTNCGGILEVDNSKEAAICPYCNTPYIVEKAINYFVTNVNFDGESIDKMLEDANTMHKKLNNKKDAAEKYLEITKKYPSDYRGHLGLADVYSNNRTDFNNEALKKYENAASTAPDSVKAEVEKVYENYQEGCRINEQICHIQAQTIRQEPARRVAMLFCAAVSVLCGVLFLATKNTIGGIALIGFGALLFWGGYSIKKGEDRADKQLAELKSKLDTIKRKL